LAHALAAHRRSRGSHVLITFLDPLCRNLWPLEARVLNALVDRLPAVQCSAIAVSVDTRGATRTIASCRTSAGRAWFRSALGGGHPRPARGGLEAACGRGRHADGGQAVNTTLAGTPVHYITHTEASYLIDPAGYAPPLFGWPFSPQDVWSAPAFPDTAALAMSKLRKDVLDAQDSPAVSA
jgi:hypothetical protein